MAKRPVTGIKYQCGDMGGRQPHPSDPNCEFFPANHTPTPMYHELTGDHSLEGKLAYEKKKCLTTA